MDQPISTNSGKTRRRKKHGTYKTPSQQAEVKALFAGGKNKTEIAHELQMARDTVINILLDEVTPEKQAEWDEKCKGIGLGLRITALKRIQYEMATPSCEKGVELAEKIAERNKDIPAQLPIATEQNINVTQ